MNLVIHDLSPEAWARIEADYAGWTVVSDRGTIRPCTGCFACWNRTPGVCAVKDGYENMGQLIHRAGEVLVISRCRYGGFSGFVKNVFDRCLGYVLPQFELVGGETHHKKRYDEDKPFRFLFYGPALTEEEKQSAAEYVRAVCANIRGTVKEITFRDCAPESPPSRAEGPCRSGRTVLLIASMRGARANSAKLARELAKRLPEEPETILLGRHLGDLDALAAGLEDAEAIVLCTPLYVDGLPSQLIRLMERMEKTSRGGPKKIYLLANMGLYESSQLRSIFSAVRQFSAAMGYTWCGGLGVSAGELIGVLMEHVPFRLGTTRTMAKGMARLAEAVASGTRMPELYAEPWAFPRSLFIAIANTSWNKTARANGLRPADLYRRL